MTKILVIPRGAKLPVEIPYWDVPDSKGLPHQSADRFAMTVLI